MPKWYERNPNTNCLVCNKTIYRRPNEIKTNKNGVFCSIMCYGISLRKEKLCIICGKLILSGQNKKTCSRVCANKNRAGMKYKLSAPRKDKVTHYRSLKIRLLKFRGKQCERCNYNKYEILQIHHKDHNKENNKLDNLELICPNCHFEEHYLEKSWLKNLVKTKT